MSKRDYAAFAEKVGYLSASKEFKKSNLTADEAAYLEDYPIISEWFSEQTVWNDASVRQGALMVYGWMPTILRTHKSNFVYIADILNENSGQTPFTREILEKPLLNNSWIGTSKFLHFWKPDDYAIWDKRVCDKLGWGYDANIRDKFFDYQDYCREYAKSNGVNMRDIEQKLFNKEQTDG